MTVLDDQQAPREELDALSLARPNREPCVAGRVQCLTPIFGAVGTGTPRRLLPDDATGLVTTTPTATALPEVTRRPAARRTTGRRPTSACSAGELLRRACDGR